MRLQVGRGAGFAGLSLFLSGFVLVGRLGSGSVLGFLSKFPPVCPLRNGLGIPCAFCGMTRAFVHLFAGDFREAHDLNALSIPVFFLTPVVFGALAVGASRRIRVLQDPRFLFGCLLLLAGYAAFRG